MSIKDKLGIVLTTYNRCDKARKTLETLLSDSAPTKDFSITVQDNNSTDGTEDMVANLQRHHPNLHYRKNKYNLGISGNIAKAMELAEREYHWNICDDDIFTWGGWEELESEISKGTPVLCVSNYLLKPQYINQFEYQLQQMTFVPGIIISTKLYTDTTIRNTVDHIFTLFPHLVPIITFHNNGGKIHVLKNPLVTNGMEKSTDCSYLRGINATETFHRSRTMTWLVGYSNVLANLNDRHLAQKCFKTVISGDHAFAMGVQELAGQIFFRFRGYENMMQIQDLLSVSDPFSGLIIRLFHFMQHNPFKLIVERLYKFKHGALPTS